MSNEPKIKYADVLSSILLSSRNQEKHWNGFAQIMWIVPAANVRPYLALKLWIPVDKVKLVNITDWHLVMPNI